jgi:hypothetical protein
MAIRPIFIPEYENNFLVRRESLEFQYFSGFAISQKQKSIASLHNEVNEKFGISNILEVSSKSKDQLGVDLSAFNLMLKDPSSGKKFSVECAFQSSKVFEYGGPYVDLLDKTSRDAKKDERIRASGNIIKFLFYNREWDILPRTAFYDWLYINALNANKQYHEMLEKYEAFTDIEFNPEKSINCQAHAIAMFMSLRHRGLLGEIKNKERFLEIYEQFNPNKNSPYIDDKSQMKMNF